MENVEVSKMYTYMENFEFNVGTTIYLAKEEDISNVNIHVRQQRLNHKPFTYKIEVSSEKEVDVYARLFMGPNADSWGEEWGLNERRHYFVEMDRFPYHGRCSQHIESTCIVDSWIITPCGLVDC